MASAGSYPRVFCLTIRDVAPECFECDYGLELPQVFLFKIRGVAPECFECDYGWEFPQDFMFMA